MNSGAGYDGSDCHCERCPNFVLCATWSPGGLCLGCRHTYRCVLRVYGQGKCDICMEDGQTLLLHPAGCGHMLCCGCMDGVFNARPDQPRPSDYGFARSCGCEDGEQPAWGTNECDICCRALERWESTENGTAWVEACIDAQDEKSTNTLCPFCRSKSKFL